MKYFTFKFNFFFFITLFISCEQDLIKKKEDAMCQEIQDAKSYFEKDFDIINQLSNSTLEWGNSAVARYPGSVNVEIPILNFKSEEISRPLNVMTRLIIRKHLSNNHYYSFVVRKIWKEPTPDMNGQSFDVSEYDSDIFTYSMNGELLNFYSCRGGKYEESINRTRSFPEDEIICGECLISNEISSERCQSCGANLYYGTASAGDFYLDKINVIWRKLRNVIRQGRIEHCQSSGCYGVCSNIGVIAYEMPPIINICYPNFSICYILEEMPLIAMNENNIINDRNLCVNIYGRWGQEFLGVTMFLDSSEAVFCARGAANYVCNSIGGGGGGGGNTTPPVLKPDPEEKCTDAKCPNCKRCLTPTKSNCLKCTCIHDHKTCLLCEKCIKSDDDTCVTRSASHTTNCLICTCVCLSCGAKVDSENGLFTCSAPFGTLYNTRIEGYQQMWGRSVKDKVEYSGYDAKDNSNKDVFIAYYLEGNAYDRCTVIGCAYDHEKFPDQAFVKYNEGGKSVVDKYYPAFGVVHTHPPYDLILPNGVLNCHDSIRNNTLEYSLLGVTQADLNSIKKGIKYNKILNRNKIFKCTNTTLENGYAVYEGTY